MCGRFTLTATTLDLARELGIGPAAFDALEYWPRYNIAPTQPHVIVRERREEPQLLPATWGLVNSWAKDAKRAASQINARAEDIERRNAFKGAVEERRRCLVPADGFFEWIGAKTARRPIWFHRPDGGLLLFAGLYESWQPQPGTWQRTFTILTTDANATVEPIHDRMPVILSTEQASEWVYEGNSPGDLRALLAPAPSELLVGDPVSPRVNSVANDDPECLTVQPSLDTSLDTTAQGTLFD
jgi:putative SOS response-associated peptidase YedK